MTITKTAYDKEDMAAAMMDSVRMIRADDRLYRLPPGSKERRSILRDIVKANADRYQVDLHTLSYKLVEVLDKSDDGYCRRHAQEELAVAEKAQAPEDEDDGPDGMPAP